jgi:hypothetical protein
MRQGFRVDSFPVEQALDFLGDSRGHEVIKHEIAVLAAGTAMVSGQRAPGQITVKVYDISRESGRNPGGIDFIGFLIGAKHPTDSPAGDMRLPNWRNYGTLGNRRGHDKKAGRKKSRAPGTGMRALRFIRKVSKTKQSEVVGLGVVKAAKKAGLDTTGWGV